MRLAIFDLDGTLADTAGDLIRAANAALAEAGFGAPLTVEDRAAAFAGGRPMLRLGLGRAGAEAAEIEALYPRLLAHYEAAICVETRLYEGARAALDGLAAAGWRLGVCTNKPEAMAERVLAGLGVRALFGAVVGPDRLGVRKPDPRHLEETIRLLGGGAAGAVLVGDTANDREAARAAGVACVLVDFGPEGGAVRAMAPEAVIGRFSELGPVLERLVPRWSMGRPIPA